PTTVGFVDDNLKFLKKRLFSLDEKQLVPELINDSLKASQFLQEQPEKGLILELLSETESENRSTPYTNIDGPLAAVHQKIYDPNRFSEISVVVIDYAMPGLNGLQICTQLRTNNSRFKILMLTGEADEKLAVEAFNTRLIDKFMRKD